jgi:hypothetical protein
MLGVHLSSELCIDNTVAVRKARLNVELVLPDHKPCRDDQMILSGNLSFVMFQ